MKILAALPILVCLALPLLAQEKQKYAIRVTGRLYTANLSELRAVYQFNVRMFVRALVQYTDLKRNPSLYNFDIDSRSRLVFPQLLFSYKVNPQTVLFVGYSSTREGDERIDVTETDRTLFVKVGYAWAM
jgi:hypothetical protein